jgi:hypothetical protein
MDDDTVEKTSIRIRPGYTEHVHDNETFIRPNVFGPGPDLPWATTRKPDLSQAVEIAGGVGYY